MNVYPATPRVRLLVRALTGGRGLRRRSWTLGALVIALAVTAGAGAPERSVETQAQVPHRTGLQPRVAAGSARLIASPVPRARRAPVRATVPGSVGIGATGDRAAAPDGRATPSGGAEAAVGPVLRTLTAAGDGGIQSDEFNSTTLNSALWRFVDPVGDAALTFDGAHAVVTLPASVSHDLWAGANGAARLLQDVPNQDFEVEVKLDSSMGSPYQLQGIVVQEDDNHLLRLEIHHDGNATRMFAAALVGGLASSLHYSTVASGSPAYLRVQRAGNVWTLRHSRDGANWTSASFTHAMTVTAIGPFVGNSGSPAPAFSGLVDHFRVVSSTPPPATDTTPPAISNVSLVPGAVAATVTWTTDEPATSEVAYGPTSAYASGTVSSTAATQQHRILLRALPCGSLYHFQLRSRDGSGNLGTTSDATFQTRACSATIRTDDFESAALDTDVWTLVDPVGDASLALNGTQAVLGVPAGVAHDRWTGIDTVPRLLQPVPNGDFEVEVKFDDAVAAGYQQQGLIIEQDAGNLLRIELHHDGGGTKLFAASFAAGTATVQHYGAVPGASPAFLRVKRAGNSWTVRKSNDGVNWTAAATFTHALTVRAMGPFVGNGGSSPPAFASGIDYFREVLPDTTPPVVTGTSASAQVISATVSWTTNELATSRVAFGPTTAYELGAQASPGMRKSHSLMIHGLRCASTYHFQVRSIDLAGNEAAGPDGTLTTGACPASLVSDEFSTATLGSGWLKVDPVGDGSFASAGGHAVISVPAGTRHDLWTNIDEVPRLLQATPDDDFEVELKFDSPVTTRYQMQGLFVQQDPRNLLRIEVHQEGGGAYLFVAGITAGTASVIHQRAVDGDAPTYLRLKRKGSKWTLRHSNDGETWTSTTFNRVLAVGAVGPYAGNSGGSPPAFAASLDYFHYLPPDKTPPQITGVSVVANAIGADVTWTTDEPATSAVAYGPTVAYEDGEAGRDGERKTHRISLHGLRCATTYHFQARSEDAEENAGASADQSFTTSACPTELTADEFDSATLNTGLWTFYNPLDDAAATASGTHAEIAIPAGVAHDVWTSSDTVPRLLQAAPDAAFEVEAKFDSPVTTRYQQMGIIVEQDRTNLLRFEIHSEGTETKLFVAAITGATASVKFNAAIADGPSAYLQVKRVGTTWTVRYSRDGETWPVSLRFEQAFVSRAIGPFAGNGGGTPPAYTSRVDYFRVVPPPPPDLTPPALTSIAAVAHRASATITWSTNELAPSTVEWGLTTAYQQPPVAAGQLTAQRARLTGLACATTYHYRVRSTDAAGNVAVSSDRTFTTRACGGSPSIVVWRGSPQTFGSVGVPQKWINVLGNVDDPDGIASLSYRLNGGASNSLSVGPSDDRLAHAGDFNIELNYGDLKPGLNSVEITATDPGGNTAVQVMQVDWQGNTNTQPPANGPVARRRRAPGRRGARDGRCDQQRPHGRAEGLRRDGHQRRLRVDVGEREQLLRSGARKRRATATAYGLLRNEKPVMPSACSGSTGLRTSPRRDLIFLGYPDGRLQDVAASGTGWTATGRGSTGPTPRTSTGRSRRATGTSATCSTASHSELYAPAPRCRPRRPPEGHEPSDIYTHAEFDGHADHSKVVDVARRCDHAEAAERPDARRR